MKFLLKLQISRYFNVGMERIIIVILHVSYFFFQLFSYFNRDYVKGKEGYFKLNEFVAELLYIRSTIRYLFDVRPFDFSSV